MVPDGLQYTKEHEWVRLEANGEAVVGITDHAQHELGDITFVETPKVGKVCKAHDALGVVESVKAASDIFAPVAGTVQAINPALAKEPEIVNRDPYGAGWICRLANMTAGALLTPQQYRDFLATLK